MKSIKQNCFVWIPCSFGRTITCCWRDWKYTSKGILHTLNSESGLIPFSEINRVRLIPVLKEYC